jgi:uncharacterized protein YjbJ (UPF0337 family)
VGRQAREPSSRESKLRGQPFTHKGLRLKRSGQRIEYSRGLAAGGRRGTRGPFEALNSQYQIGGFIMDWNRVEGNWKQMKGKVKEQWGKLTDDDLDVINGKREQLEGRLQQRYGYGKDQAQKEINDWYGRQGW